MHGRISYVLTPVLVGAGVGGADGAMTHHVMLTLSAYMGGYIFLCFLAGSLATGLYYLAELVEEYSKLTAKVLKHTIQGVAGMHVLLFLMDGTPFTCLLVSLAACAAHGMLLKPYPYISLSSPEFIASCVLTAIQSWMWAGFFREGFTIDSRTYGYYTTEMTLGFFLIMVLLVPFGFFISLSANEGVLPSQSTGSFHGLAQGAAIHTRSGSGMGDMDTGGGGSDMLPGMEGRKRRSKNVVIHLFRRFRAFFIRQKGVVVAFLESQFPGFKAQFGVKRGRA